MRNDKTIHVILLSLVVTCTARSPRGFEVNNVITVPHNCKLGQLLMNGECRDIWRSSPVEESALSATQTPLNVITVPANCPPGQQLINGQCRDVWKVSVIKEPALGVTPEPFNVITVPANCPEGQELINGECRDVWRISAQEYSAIGVTAAPLNVITVPPNCPPGQELINGQCRDVWVKGNTESTLLEKIMAALQELSASEKKQAIRIKGVETANFKDTSLKNVISVPNQCPAGYVPDALGVCREIFPA